MELYIVYKERYLPNDKSQDILLITDLKSNAYTVIGDDYLKETQAFSSKSYDNIGELDYKFVNESNNEQFLEYIESNKGFYVGWKIIKTLVDSKEFLDENNIWIITITENNKITKLDIALNEEEKTNILKRRKEEVVRDCKDSGYSANRTKLSSNEYTVYANSSSNIEKIYGNIKFNKCSKVLVLWN